MKKMIVVMAALLLALPGAALAQTATGLVGDCYDCHTMHNSENGLPVAVIGGAVTGDAIPNLLRLDCIACHANNPTGGTKLWNMPGGSVVPQVAHGDGSTQLAGGNFSYGIGDSSKVHNVRELFTGQWDSNGGDPSDQDGDGEAFDEFGAPPGTAPAAHYHGMGVFTTDSATPFDAFTCAGARGCHGTRSQVLTGKTGDADGNAATANSFILGARRVGMAAISGAHHNSYDGAKDGENYPRTDDLAQVHDGQRVADGYRFIPGLKGYGNETTRWENVSAAEHNEYYGDNDGIMGNPTEMGTSQCHVCHVEGHTGGLNSRAAFNSTLNVPGNSMSGFCSTCHGNFHTGGLGLDYNNGSVNNGVSGAFLRHPSDYIIPNTGEYAAYRTYDLSAPVARNDVFNTSYDIVTPGIDMVMCLSCHVAHGSANDYILRFPYAGMEAGGYDTIGDAQAVGGCLACHTEKGVLPGNR